MIFLACILQRSQIPRIRKANRKIDYRTNKDIDMQKSVGIEWGK